MTQQPKETCQRTCRGPMSRFGLIEENIELSHIHLAVKDQKLIAFSKTIFDSTQSELKNKSSF